jgi:hypothetical protein
VTPNVPGYYEISCKAVLAFSSTVTSLHSFIRKNGVVWERGGNMKPAAVNINTGAPTVVTFIACNGTTDYFEGGVSFAATANQATNVVPGSSSTLQAKYLRPL